MFAQLDINIDISNVRGMAGFFFFFFFSFSFFNLSPPLKRAANGIRNKSAPYGIGNTVSRFGLAVRRYVVGIERKTSVRFPVIVQELCESRGGRPGLSVLTSLMLSVDVKLY